MPAGSFSLILDGDPFPEQASEAFEIMKDDAAWQIAQIQWYANQSLEPDWITTRNGGFYLSSVYPQAIKEIVEGRSFIRCNFPTGELHDPQRVLDNYRHINNDSIQDPSRPGAFFFKEHGTVRLRSTRLQPLPTPFADFALEDFIPKEQQRSMA